MSTALFLSHTQEELYVNLNLLNELSFVITTLLMLNMVIRGCCFIVKQIGKATGLIPVANLNELFNHFYSFAAILVPLSSQYQIVANPPASCWRSSLFCSTHSLFELFALLSLAASSRLHHLLLGEGIYTELKIMLTCRHRRLSRKPCYS